MTARGFRKKGDAFQDLWRKSADAHMDDAALAEAYGRFRKAAGDVAGASGRRRTWLMYAASVALAVAAGFVGAHFVDSGRPDGARAVPYVARHAADRSDTSLPPRLTVCAAMAALPDSRSARHGAVILMCLMVF